MTARASLAIRLTSASESFAARRNANLGTPNPQSAQFAVVASGTALESLIAETTRRRDDGLAIRPAAASRAAVHVGFVESIAGSVSLSACTIDDGVIYRVATDEIVKDGVVTNNYMVDLRQVDTMWKVTSLRRVQQWEGVAGCAFASSDFPY